MTSDNADRENSRHRRRTLVRVRPDADDTADRPSRQSRGSATPSQRETDRSWGEARKRAGPSRSPSGARAISGGAPLSSRECPLP
jgi:hypothetical protein